MRKKVAMDKNSMEFQYKILALYKIVLRSHESILLVTVIWIILLVTVIWILVQSHSHNTIISIFPRDALPPNYFKDFLHKTIMQQKQGVQKNITRIVIVIESCMIMVYVREIRLIQNTTQSIQYNRGNASDQSWCTCNSKIADSLSASEICFANSVAATLHFCTPEYATATHGLETRCWTPLVLVFNGDSNILVRVNGSELTVTGGESLANELIT